MEGHLHIITLNVPYPPDYGGMIDTFYRLESLKKIGIRIHLHCFEYNRPRHDYLENLCYKVYYYPRKTGLLHQFSTIPYIVYSRNSDQLLSNLLLDNYPVFFDGLHTTYFIDHPSLAGRYKMVRLHNIEYRYYKDLARNEKDPFTRLYFHLESLKLCRYERKLKNADTLIAVSKNDMDHYNSLFNNTQLIFPFHPFEKSESLPGSGNYILYHADLSVNENVIFANYLIRKVFSRISARCIIAGRKPDKGLASEISVHDNISLIADPDNEAMGKLIREAHINIVSSQASTGYKIKLLITMFSGRHCIANSKITKDTHLEKLCYTADSDTDIINVIHKITDLPFSEKMKNDRQAVLNNIYNNHTSAGKIAKLVFKENMS